MYTHMEKMLSKNLSCFEHVLIYFSHVIHLHIGSIPYTLEKARHRHFFLNVNTLKTAVRRRYTCYGNTYRLNVSEIMATPILIYPQSINEATNTQEDL